MSIEFYRNKRNFNKTSEPKGSCSYENNHLFLIQKHAASHLHYDFRLELNGVLLSWAVPKGPCFDPTVKRLAMHVEDHPVEYGYFEGIIPKGQYGGGTVMLWDQGTWKPIDQDPTKAYKSGHLRFELNAQKLKGRWDLVRFKDEEHWFLIKFKDEFAQKLEEYDIIEEEPNSVLSNLSIEEIGEKYNFESANELPSKAPTKKNIKKLSSKKALELPDNLIVSPYPGFMKRDTKKTEDHSFKMTHPDKILYPDDGFTKQDLFNYYELVCDYIMPFIQNRPLSLVRCPENRNDCFYQRHFTDSIPKALKAISIGTNGENEPYIYLNTLDGLLRLAQMNVLEIHPWGSLISNIEKPDLIVFDLDPAPSVTWETIVKAAFEIKKHLDEFKLTSFAKTTGGKGLHVVVPIEPKYDWDDVKNFTRVFVEFLERINPDDYISNMNKKKRKGKIFIDYLRNQRGATAISPYSTRSHIHAPVSVPVHWDELSNEKRDTEFTIKTLPKRLESLKKDPWEDYWKINQSLRLDSIL